MSSLSRKSRQQGGFFDAIEKFSGMEKISQSEQYTSLLIHLVRADGIIAKDEESVLRRLLSERLVNPPDAVRLQGIRERLTASGPAQPSDADLLSAGHGMDAHTLCHLVRDAYRLAASDGEVHATEIKTMRRYLRLVGIPIERFADIDLWARRADASLEIGQALLTPPTSAA